MSLEVIPREMRIAGKQTVVESDATLVPAPSLEALAATVRHEHQLVLNAGQKMIDHAIICGTTLSQAKTRVKYGEWRRWLAENCDVSFGTAALYMRMSCHVELLRENGIQSTNAAVMFLRDHQLYLDDPTVPQEKVDQIRKLGKSEMSHQEIADVVGVSRATVSNYLRDERHGRRGRGKHEHRGLRRRGRRTRNSRGTAITDDLVEGAAIKLRELFGPGTGDVTDSDRDAAVEVLRAAFTYTGPIPGEQR